MMHTGVDIAAAASQKIVGGSSVLVNSRMRLFVVATWLLGASASTSSGAGLHPPQPNRRRQRSMEHVSPPEMNQFYARIDDRPPVTVAYDDHPHEHYERHGRELSNRSQYFRPIRIAFDTTALDIEYDKAEGDITRRARIDALRNDILPEMRENFAQVLSVIPVAGSLPIVPTAQACYGMANVKQEYIDNGVPDADLVIFVDAQESIGGVQFCCPTCKVFAGAAACEKEQYDRPIAGMINFCLHQIDVLADNVTIASQTLEESINIAQHEIIHVLGFHHLLYRFYREPATGIPLTPRPFCYSNNVMCTDGKMAEWPVIMPANNTLQKVVSKDGDLVAYEMVTPTVRQVARNQFNCQEVTGARLENQPTIAGDCFGSHFEEKLALDEAMSAYVQPEGMRFSALTLALLEDTGWYKANFENAQIPSWGHMAGCDFWDIDKDCISDGSIPTASKGFFCDNVSSVNRQTKTVTGDYICYPDHTHMAMCDLFDMDSLGLDSPPTDRSYFPDPTLGPFFKTADYCPIPYHNSINCEDGDFTDSRLTPMAPTTAKLPGEVFAPGSKCFDTTSDADGSSAAVCLKSRCNPQGQTVDVTIGSTVLSCRVDFEEHQYPSLEGIRTFVCPRLSAICPDMFCPANCSGKGVCQYDTQTATSHCECFDVNDSSDACLYSLPADVEWVDTICTREQQGEGADIPPSNKVAASTTSAGTRNHRLSVLGAALVLGAIISTI